MADPRDKETVAGFARGLRVIEAFDASSPRLSISEVAARTGLQRATARRCLLTLAAGGYAEFDGKYFRLTPRLLRLGHAYLASTPLPRLVQPWLEQLAQETDESCSASILDGAHIVYVARASQRRVMSIGLNVGSRLPAYCSSMGRVLLGALPERERRSLLEAAPRRPWTPRTLTAVDDLLVEIEQVRQQGYALIDQELEIGLRSIAVPLHDAQGRVVAAINVGAQAERAAIETMRDAFLPRMRAIQAELAPLLS